MEIYNDLRKSASIKRGEGKKPEDLEPNKVEVEADDDLKF